MRVLIIKNDAGVPIGNPKSKVVSTDEGNRLISEGRAIPAPGGGLVETAVKPSSEKVFR